MIQFDAADTCAWLLEGHIMAIVDPETLQKYSAHMFIIQMHGIFVHIRLLCAYLFVRVTVQGTLLVWLWLAGSLKS